MDEAKIDHLNVLFIHVKYLCFYRVVNHQMISIITGILERSSKSGCTVGKSVIENEERKPEARVTWTISQNRIINQHEYVTPVYVWYTKRKIR